MMVHVSYLYVVAVAVAVLTLIVVSYLKRGPDVGEYLSKIRDLERRLTTENSEKNGYKTAYINLCHATKNIDLGGEGARRIFKERIRQKVVEGWTPSHDAQHLEGELSVAAACYAVWDVELNHQGVSVVLVESDYDAWPWAQGWDKRKKHDRIRRLEIAGALIAAEIDRLFPNIHPMAVKAEKEV